MRRLNLPPSGPAHVKPLPLWGRFERGRAPSGARAPAGRCSPHPPKPIFRRNELLTALSRGFILSLANVRSSRAAPTSPAATPVRPARQAGLSLSRGPAEIRPEEQRLPSWGVCNPRRLTQSREVCQPGASFIQRSVPTRALPEWDKCAPRAFSRVGKCATRRVRLSSWGVCIQRLPRAGKCATPRAPPRSRSVPQQARSFQTGASIGQPLPPERTFGAPCPPPARGSVRHRDRAFRGEVCGFGP